ncbi:signal peptide peptidase SppA [Zhengella mangrovi]|uniref:Signal peptide peptidase SppA n=1 Tax=Zhengella mangrovi TaxID=1982044 RepID=A0A2G1QTD1_9HYPH|nr:signal peptide peptidase SppA [Zhengella mangrovi]PHP68719.1 signal peptide peptidase SppA [Zhengella mangrovi]
MNQEADSIIDRRRLRRKVTFWRVAAFVVAGLAIIVVAATGMRDEFSGKGSDHIAQIRIEGTITEDEDLLKRINDVRKADRVKGVVLTIDSPGGTTVGGEAIFEAVRKLAEKKPVVAQVGTLAASAGYMIASASDHIVARKTSIVGSIGVLAQIPNVASLLDKIGVRVDTIKSAPLKAEPSPFNETTEAERAMMRSMIMDSFEWFVGLVADRRPLSEDEVRRLADGSVFTGRQALERKLVDELGGMDEAKAWLETKGVGTDLKVIEWKKPADSTLGGLPLALASQLLGLETDSLAALKALAGEGLFLDGLLSLWQPVGAIQEN